MGFAGKVAIVTGSSRGIGKAIALELAREGADIVVAARTETAGPIPGTIGETAQAIRAIGRRAVAVKCNLLEETEIERMVQRAVDEFGRVDILINNAGVNVDKALVDTTSKQWDIGMGLNVRAPFLCCRAVIPWIARQGGSILNISSPVADELTSTVPGSDQVRLLSINYGASKAALERLTRGLALEVAKLNMAVNALKPTAPTRTEGMVRMFPEMDVGGLWVDPRDYMTKAALFLAAQNAHGVTGRIFDDQALCREFGL